MQINDRGAFQCKKTSIQSRAIFHAGVLLASTLNPRNGMVEAFRAIDKGNVEMLVGNLIGPHGNFIPVTGDRHLGKVLETVHGYLKPFIVMLKRNDLLCPRLYQGVGGDAGTKLQNGLGPATHPHKSIVVLIPECW